MTYLITRVGDAHFRLWWLTNAQRYKDKLMYYEPTTPFGWKLLERQSSKYTCYFSSRRLRR